MANDLTSLVADIKKALEVVEAPWELDKRPLYDPLRLLSRALKQLEEAQYEIDWRDEEISSLEEELRDHRCD
jgi:23S rRNA A2030 N6-methylase RlmJ